MTPGKNYSFIRCPYCNAVLFEISDDSVAVIRIKCRKCHNYSQVEANWSGATEARPKNTPA